MILERSPIFRVLDDLRITMKSGVAKYYLSVYEVKQERGWKSRKDGFCQVAIRL
jgi:hypothetical protein